MSIALVIRNINPDRQDNSELVVVTLTEQQAGLLPPEFDLDQALADDAVSSGQLYCFPQKQNKFTPAPLMHEQAEACNLQDMEYLWCSTLDQAG